MLLHDRAVLPEDQCAGRIVLLEAQIARCGIRIKSAKGRRSGRSAEDLCAGPYQVQAAIKRAPRRCRDAGGERLEPDRGAYTTLMMMIPSAVIEINRAVAFAMAQGPFVGLTLLHRLDYEAVADYYPYHAALADLLRRTESA